MKVTWALVVFNFAENELEAGLHWLVVTLPVHSVRQINEKILSQNLRSIIEKKQALKIGSEYSLLKFNVQVVAVLDF